MTMAPLICFGQQPCGFFPRRYLVAKIQTLLADAGYDPGPADGKIGQKTVDAVKAYQQKAGVPVTGRIDKTLVASLSENQT